MTAYGIELCYESGQIVEIPLAVAKTASQATKAMCEYLVTNRQVLLDTNTFLCFRRSNDGQHGYLNQDGAAPVGKAWNILEAGRTQLSGTKKAAKVAKKLSDNEIPREVA